jgi:glutamine---fructose-6-phosphate transaminase (isomerizing)
MHHSYSEIFQQHESLGKTMDHVLANKAGIIRFFETTPHDEIVFIACGSSYWSSVSSAMTFSEQTGIRCTAVKSGDVVLNPDYYRKLFKKPLVIAPSRSGSTSETLIAIDLFKQWHASPVLCLVGYENAPMVPVSDFALEMNWINETSVCQTRAFSSLYLAMVLVAGLLGKDERLVQGLREYVTNFPTIAPKIGDQVKQLTDGFPDYKALVVVANGKQYGVAIEGAYINVEMAQFPSHYYGTLELRHGPIVMLNSDYLTFVCCKDQPNDYEVGLLPEIKRTGGRSAVIASGGDCPQADYCFSYGREVPQEVASLFAVFVLQALAYHKAVQLGYDPDQPKELVQWIKI